MKIEGFYNMQWCGEFHNLSLWLDWKITIPMKYCYFCWLYQQILLLWETSGAFLKEYFLPNEPVELQWCSCTTKARRAEAAGPQPDIPVGVAVVFGSEDRQQPAEEQHHQANASKAHNCKRCTGRGCDATAAPGNTTVTQVFKPFCSIYRFGQMRPLFVSLRNTKLTPIFFQFPSVHQFYTNALRKSPFFSPLLAKCCKASSPLSICQKGLSLSCSLLSNSKNCQKSKWFFSA